MSYDLDYKGQALANLERLTKVERNRILNKIDWLAANFNDIIPDPLRGNLSGLYKLRVGVYRVVYSFSDEPPVITIHRLGHRRDVYDD